MDESFEEMVKDLQKKIEHDEEKNYSKTVIKEYRNPSYFGVLKSANAIVKYTGPCHDTMKFYLYIHKNRIVDARFWTDGCGATLASGNRLIKMILGKTIQQAEKITTNQLLNELDGLPDEHLHCASLAFTALQKTLTTYTQKEMRSHVA